MGHRCLTGLAGSAGSPLRIRRAIDAGVVAVAVVICLGAVSCSSGSTDASANGPARTPMSPTIPPGYAGSEGTIAPGSGTTLALPSDVPSTSVRPENQAFCEAIQQSGGLFSGPGDSADDATAIQQIKDTFTNLVAVAPPGIKPEVEGMNHTIQALGSARDIEKLDNPNFTAEQEALAAFVLQNCGFEMVG